MTQAQRPDLVAVVLRSLAVHPDRGSVRALAEDTGRRPAEVAEAVRVLGAAGCVTSPRAPHDRRVARLTRAGYARAAAEGARVCIIGRVWVAVEQHPGSTAAELGRLARTPATIAATALHRLATRGAVRCEPVPGGRARRWWVADGT